jgi:hypothetical protein
VNAESVVLTFQATLENREGLLNRAGPSIKPFKQWLKAPKLGRPIILKAHMYKPILVINIFNKKKKFPAAAEH